MPEQRSFFSLPIIVLSTTGKMFMNNQDDFIFSMLSSLALKYWRMRSRDIQCPCQKIALAATKIDSETVVSLED
jgi:hypothetical protein